MAITDPVDTHGHTVADALAGERRLHLDNDDGTALAIAGVAATNVFTADDDHGLVVGDPIVFDTVDDTTDLAVGTTYWVLTVPSATTFTIAKTKKSKTVLDLTVAVAVTIRAPFTLAQTAAEVNAQLSNGAG